MKTFETKASLTSKGTMTLTKTKILDTMCPTCKAKEGEECSISGDVMMVKQFQDIHWSREQKAKQLLEFNAWKSAEGRIDLYTGSV